MAGQTSRRIISPNKIAIVTGGSRGIGRNTVVSLAKCGVDSIFTYNSNQAEAERVIGLVAEAGQKAIALQLDTGNVGAFETFVQSVQSALKDLGATHFDYLVNNAGNITTTWLSRRRPRKNSTAFTAFTSKVSFS
jgi:NAD(P)-dependent dehydrogenase (short-subunit alcohol dehydrogenase family)